MDFRNYFVKSNDDDGDGDDSSIPDLGCSTYKDESESRKNNRKTAEQKEEIEKAKAELQVCMTSLKPNECDTGLLLDSGAAIHCGSSEEYMINTIRSKKGDVTVASGMHLNAKKVGTIHFEDKKMKSIISLHGYHCVPGLSKEMISLGNLIDDGWTPKYTSEAIHL
jgi:hypothetical protein